MSSLKDISPALGVWAGPEVLSASRGLSLGDLPAMQHARLHEVTGALGTALALAAAGRCERPVFWMSGGRGGLLHAGGVSAFAQPNRIICIRVANRDEALWAGEQALRCPGAGLVVIELCKGPDLFESRRLQIAAQVGGGLGLVLVGGEVQSSAAQTRWDCSLSSESGEDWRWRLTKNKQGMPGEWSVRGDPDPTLTHPPDLLPADLAPSHAFTLTTTARAAPAAAAARPLAPA